MNSLINGQPSEEILIGDRGLAYGDGLFETIEVSQGRLVYWQRHLNRLTDGCNRLSIPTPDGNQLFEEANRLLEPKCDGVLKIIITRGSGGRGYSFPDPLVPTRIITIHPQPNYPSAHSSQGIGMKVCSSRLGINPQIAGIKHLNRLEQVMGRAELNSSQQEGLMLDYEGHPVEGIMSNLFWVTSGVIFTPDLTLCGVPGVIRAAVIELAEENEIPCRIGRFSMDNLLAANEVFMTNSLIGIWPVRNLGTQQFTLGRMTEKIVGLLDSDKKKDLERD
jgi:4-amino-4-deoxychorismate lyase